MQKSRLIIIFAIVLLAVIAALVMGPVAQDPKFHTFADQRTILSVPNFWNVVTDLPLVIVGAMGMLLLARGKAIGGLTDLRATYFLFFLGVFGSGIGSAYYHNNPVNETLLWDRMPITVSLMAFFSAVVGEQISLKAGRKLVWFLTALGIFSVLSWYVSELRGAGDLRLYGLVQFLPVVLTPIILLLYKSTLMPAIYLWSVVGAYGLAKLAEALDSQIYTALRILSGHSLKHILAALGAYFFYQALRKRKNSVTRPGLP